MSNLQKIDSMLKNQEFSRGDSEDTSVYCYAESIAMLENCVAVVSDLKLGQSRIYAGEFASYLGLENYSAEDSIWEKQILSLMSDEEREEKYLAEMRFFNYVRRRPRNKRPLYYLATRLMFNLRDGQVMEVQHRMYYRYEEDGETVRYGICVYSPSLLDFKAKSVVVNSVTGEAEALAHSSDNTILSRRETQVLALIDRGLTSQRIADRLFISKYTVSRHRQEIIAKLRVRNSTEACRLARQLNMI